ncbi:hypothetical protein M0R89_10100 [Halorussus limi]|uniref:DUF8054 domain-containing protein n=1 Tax=Halorussus limi TaxID=2938695 RepID=A0A8U0HPL5_9EURY|nr:hypothetical protein [Halorussus limi]UPV72900.1 hypothetical protein M0R89_10100 [Halorussus limi]
MTPVCSLDSDLPDLPNGTLVRSRVESDLTAPLAAALDRELTGYAVLEPQDALLLDAEGAGVVAFEAGVPRFAYHTGTGRGGPAALADLAVPGPYDVALRRAPDALAAVAALDRRDLRVSPGLVADRLAGDPDLAERTRAVAPSEWHDAGGADDDAGVETSDKGSASDSGSESDRGPASDSGSPSAVEAFLDDEEKIDAIRDRAREEARERAEEWGLEGELQ